MVFVWVSSCTCQSDLLAGYYTTALSYAYVRQVGIKCKQLFTVVELLL